MLTTDEALETYERGRNDGYRQGTQDCKEHDPAHRLERDEYWHFGVQLVGGVPVDFMCFCLEEEHDDLMQWVGNYPHDHRPAPHELRTLGLDESHVA